MKTKINRWSLQSAAVFLSLIGPRTSLKTNTAPRAAGLPRASRTLFLCGVAAVLWAVSGTANAQLPELGNYPDTSIPLSDNAIVTPDAPPANTTSINVATSTDFKGKLEGDPATGIVRITDAHPAGIYTVTVTAFNSAGATTSKAFLFTVTTPVTCNPVIFATAANFGVGEAPFLIAIGDFNGDGEQDLVTPNINSDNVSVLLGDGTGGFSAATNFAAGAVPISVAVGDFNGDGRQDLAVANNGSDTVSVLLGDGVGGFIAATNFGVGNEPRSVAVGDFNGDGKQDLAVTNEASNNVSVLLGSGAGGFPTTTNFAVGTDPRSVVVGDFNGDGKQDLATANTGSDNVSILLGDGTGSFGVATNFAGGLNDPFSLAIGDFNGDGKQDLVVANPDTDNVSVLLGNGAGGFGAATNFGVGDQPRSASVGDFNGDGKQDLAVANTLSNNVSVLLGNGLGSFGAATNFGAGTGPDSVAIGDFNGDGMQDIATANADSDNVSILSRQCPTSTPTPPPTPTPEPPSPTPAPTPTPTPEPPTPTPTPEPPTPTPTPTPTCAPPPPDMVSWWPGDGNAQDIEGTNHGTLQGGAGFTAGKVDQAFHAGDESGFVTFPGDGTLNITGNQVTIDAWIRLEDNPTLDQRFTGVIGKNIYPSGQPYEIIFEGGPIAGNLGNILPPNQWQFEYILTDEIGNRHHNQATAVIVTVDGEYHHFAMTYDGALVQLYVDGALRYTSTFSGNLIAAPTVPVTIEGGAPFSADEVEIFSRALTASEVLSLYAAGSEGKCKPTPTPTPTPIATPTPPPSPTPTPTPTPTPSPTPPPTGGNGSFVIGDVDAVVGRKVYFWGSQWAKKNNLSQGTPPSAFKGFANSIGAPIPNCGGVWRSDPGNSSGPPNSVPTLITVIASSTITKSGSVINGNNRKIVVVRTDPGYGPNPGHAGTGTVVSVTCQ